MKIVDIKEEQKNRKRSIDVREHFTGRNHNTRNLCIIHIDEYKKICRKTR